MNQIALIDYGLGNLFSVARALKAAKANYFFAGKPEDLQKADKLILPGVGAFADGMKGLKKRKLNLAIQKEVKKGKPILGICLGMQLLMEEGQEFGTHRGLGLIPGKVNKIKTNEKLPQIGWNTINNPEKNNWKEGLLDGVKNGEFFYFVHSYVVRPKDKTMTIAVTNYGGDEFCSVISYNQVYGTQFHPEKSANFGLKIYGNFINKVKLG